MIFSKLNEEFYNNGVDEHLDVVGGPNTDKLKTCINIIKSTWESSDDYWIVEIRSRKKDLSKYGIEFNRLDGWLGVGGGNRVGYSYIFGKTSDEAIEKLKNIQIHVYPWVVKALNLNSEYVSSNDNNMNALYELCDKFFARAYFSINKRTFSGTRENIELFYKNNKDKIKNLSLDSYEYLNFAIEAKGVPIFAFIDCDIDPNEESKFKKGVYGQSEIDKLFSFLKSHGIRVVKTDESHDGLHIYLLLDDVLKSKIKQKDFAQFDCIKKDENGNYIREFSKNKSYDDSVKMKKDSSLLLYSPCGTAPKNNPIINTVKGDKENGRLKKKRQKQAHNWENIPSKERRYRMNTMKNNIIANINESDIHNMVYMTIVSLINESSVSLRGKIGKNGPLTLDNLINTKDLFKHTIELYNKYKNTKKTLNISNIFANDPGYAIWRNYVKSMTGIDKEVPLLSKNGKQVYDSNNEPIFVPELNNVKTVKARDLNGNIIRDGNGNIVTKEYPKKAIGFFSWIRNLIEHNSIEEFGGLPSKIYAFKYGDSYVFGYYNIGIFIVNSFSGGKTNVFSVIKELCQYNNIIFSVSMDLAPMLKSLGLYTDGKIHTTVFSGREVDKVTLTTNKDLLGVISKINSRNEKQVNNRIAKKEKDFKKKKRCDFTNDDEKEFKVDNDFLTDIMKDKGITRFAMKNPKPFFDLLSDKEFMDAMNKVKTSND